MLFDAGIKLKMYITNLGEVIKNKRIANKQTEKIKWNTKNYSINPTEGRKEEIRNKEQMRQIENKYQKLHYM